MGNCNCINILSTSRGGPSNEMRLPTTKGPPLRRKSTFDSMYQKSDKRANGEIQYD